MKILDDNTHNFMNYPDWLVASLMVDYLSMAQEAGYTHILRANETIQKIIEIPIEDDIEYYKGYSNYLFRKEYPNHDFDMSDKKGV